MLHGCIYTLQEENYSLVVSLVFFCLCNPLLLFKQNARQMLIFQPFQILEINGVLNVIKLGITL